MLENIDEELVRCRPPDFDIKFVNFTYLPVLRMR